MTTEEVSTWRGQEFTFGSFRFNPEQRLLLSGDTPVALGSRAREILLLLLERSGETISKHHLLTQIWPGVVVGEGTLRVHIAALRKSLAGRPGDRGYIENVTGYGYRFVAPVTRRGTPPLPLGTQPTGDLHDGLPVLPPHFVGRAPVVASLVSDVLKRRFVTIVGPGGIGKTTVAVAAAHELQASCVDGVCYIELASVTDAALLAGTVASALGLTSVSGDSVPNIARFLQQKKMLLVLDNCEQIVEAVALLAEELLKRAADVMVIATSREPLGATGEWVLRLASLDLPPPGALLTAAEAHRFSAVELFVARATASLHTFQLRDADVRTVADICRKLDGVPLAIELAASRVDLLGVHGLEARLEDRVGLFTMSRRTAVARHRTLRATLDWSHELLLPEEQIALRRLAVFSGVFDLPGAIAVVADHQVNAAVVEDLLAGLAAKSLVAVHVLGRQVLFRLLETTRAYALEQMEKSFESTPVKRRHAQLCRSWGHADPDAEPRSPGCASANSSLKVVSNEARWAMLR